MKFIPPSPRPAPAGRGEPGTSSFTTEITENTENLFLIWNSGNQETLFQEVPEFVISRFKCHFPAETQRRGDS